MVKIRKFTEKDEKPVKECISELKKWETQFDKDYRVSEESVIELYDSIVDPIEDGKAHIFVAEINDEVVGFISCSYENKDDELICKKVPCLYISDLVIKERFRSRGIGKLLMKRAEKLAKRENMKYLKLDVYSKNIKAIKFYGDLGFNDHLRSMLKPL